MRGVGATRGIVVGSARVAAVAALAVVSAVVLAVVLAGGLVVSGAAEPVRPPDVPAAPRRRVRRAP
jgi:hypothetical protein